MSKIISLCYHDVKDEKLLISGFNSIGSNLYTLDVNTFCDQMKLLKKDHVILVDDFTQIMNEDKFVLTFDDAGLSAYEVILPVLEDLRLKAHFFIPTKFIGSNNFLNESQIKEISKLGHKIGSHSSSHPNQISRLSTKMQNHEWQSSISVLEDITGENINCASIPNGDVSNKVYECMVNNGIKYIFNSYPTSNVKKFHKSYIFGRFAFKNNYEIKFYDALLENNRKYIFIFSMISINKMIIKKLLGKYYLKFRNYFLHY